MKTLLIVFISTLFLFTTFTSISAHPGKTAADGCHYCRTNCAKWGEVEGARHCHGGGSVEGVETVAPVSSVKPKVKPSPTPIPKCSDISDFVCPKNCTAGNDADCCTERLGADGYQWYENWGCYEI